MISYLLAIGLDTRRSVERERETRKKCDGYIFLYSINRERKKKRERETDVHYIGGVK